MTEERDDPSAEKPVADTTRVIDADGRRWIVREAPYVALDRRGTCLIFENDEVIRRVRDFPPDWRSLPDDTLYELSLQF